MLHAVHAIGKIYTHRSNRKILDKHVRDLAWLIVKYKFGDPVISLKVKKLLTKKKRILRYVEIKGSMTLSANETVTFTVTNNWGFGYRMVANVARNGKVSFTTHGHVAHCFEVMSALGTK